MTVTWSPHAGALVVPTREQIARFLTHVEMTEDCWWWTGATIGAGGREATTRYGNFRLASRYHPPPNHIRAHRFAFAAWVRQPDPGLVLDHLCCHGLCVNPDHLEEVTSGENTRRYYGSMDF